MGGSRAEAGGHEEEEEEHQEEEEGSRRRAGVWAAGGQGGRQLEVKRGGRLPHAPAQDWRRSSPIPPPTHIGPFALQLPHGCRLVARYKMGTITSERI